MIALLSASESLSFMLKTPLSVILSGSLCSFLFVVSTAFLPVFTELLINCLKWIEKGRRI